jgi:hypothetical protein
MRTTEYHPIQQNSRQNALFHSPAAPSETQHSGQIKKNRPQGEQTDKPRNLKKSGGLEVGTHKIHWNWVQG